MDPATFKDMAASIQKVVDQRNRRYRIRRLFSLNTLWRVREAGLAGSLGKVLKILRPVRSSA